MNKLNMILIVWFMAMCCCNSNTRADTIYVDSDVASPGDGSSWGRAFNKLENALAIAVSDDQIWVATGVYYPPNANDPTSSFVIPDGVRVYGGFRGNEQDIDDRGDPFDHPTALNGSAGPSYSVVQMIDCGISTVLDGFIIEKGNAVAAAGLNQQGGGIRGVNSTPVLRNLIIRNNEAAFRGSGVYLDGTVSAFAVVEDCVFDSNRTSTMFETHVPTIVQSCTFLNAIDAGALRGMFSGIMSITDCLFVGNTGGTAGTPLSFYMESADSYVEITDCVIRDNSGNTGAITVAGQGNYEIRSCLIQGNEGLSCGALRILSSLITSTLIENTLFTGNNTVGGAGAILIEGSQITRIINTTIAANNATSTPAGGITINTTRAVHIDNSILWGNIGTGTPRQDTNLFADPLDDLIVNRSIVQGLGTDFVPAGVAIVGSDPMFVDLDGDDDTPGTLDDNARLMPGSPAIDAGSNLIVGPAVLSDIYGSTRFADDAGTPDTGVDDGLGLIVDMGAAEFQGTTIPPCIADFTGDGILDFFDISAFLNAYNAQSPAADFNHDGQYDFFDISLYLSFFNAGCP